MGLALFFGVLGLQWFYLGRFRRGFLYVGLGLFGISLYVGVIDAIRWIRLSDIEFERRYGRGRYTERRRHQRLYTVQKDHFLRLDYRDVDRLRREWKVDVYDPAYGTPRAESERWSDEAPVINPATGLLMLGGIGGIDAGGHFYGTGFEQDDLSHWHRDDDAFGRNADDTHRGIDDSPFKPWEP
ncbi:hypothetical protein SAMN04488038_104200 [Solimonas aquatica]|uniref:TM2 domain-containing protein n=2 Tax=Nevskiaceae TaxID=568386 RepID=A0A1H9DXC4_9GAMM|nr:hypothetical protein SAMN04488038_104200 [Solimonas aquatica]